MNNNNNNNQRKNGRNFYDLIAEHPKLTFFTFLAILLVFILLAVLKVPFKIGNVELGNNSKAIHDTIIRTKIDTQWIKPPTVQKIIKQYPKNNTEKPMTTINAKNVNNAPNFGSQMVGDVVVNNPIQRKLDEVSKVHIIRKIDSVITANKISKKTKISIGATQGNEEARQFAIEIAEFLYNEKYNIERVGMTMWNEENGFKFQYIKNQEEINFDVGVVPKMP